MRVAHRAPEGSPALGPAPAPEARFPAFGSRPQAGQPVTLMRSRHWDGVRS